MLDSITGGIINVPGRPAIPPYTSIYHPPSVRDNIRSNILRQVYETVLVAMIPICKEACQFLKLRRARKTLSRINVHFEFPCFEARAANGRERVRA